MSLSQLSKTYDTPKKITLTVAGLLALISTSPSLASIKTDLHQWSQDSFSVPSQAENIHQQASIVAPILTKNKIIPFAVNPIVVAKNEMTPITELDKEKPKEGKGRGDLGGEKKEEEDGDGAKLKKEHIPPECKTSKCNIAQNG